MEKVFNNQVQYFMGIEKKDLMKLLGLRHHDKLRLDDDGYFINK